VVKPLDHIPTERVLEHCKEVLETLLEKAHDAYEWTTDEGPSAPVDLSAHMTEIRDAIRKIDALKTERATDRDDEDARSA